MPVGESAGDAGPSPAASVRATRTFAALPRPGRGLRRAWAALSMLLTWRRISLGHRLGQQLARITRDDHVYLVLLAAFTGVLAGSSEAVLLAWIDWVHGVFPEPGGEGVLRFVLVVGLPTAGGLAVGALRHGLRRFVRVRVVEGPPGVIEAVAVHGGRIRGLGAPATGLGTGLSIAGGASVGHEGPSVAIGATVGSVLAGFFGMRRRRRTALVAAGAAAGIAAAFNAPLAGVIFAVEIVAGGAATCASSTLHTFLPLIVAAVASTFTSYGIMGERHEFAVSGLATPAPVEIVAYVVLAVVAGLLGAGFVRGVLAVSRWGARRLPLALMPALGGLGVGLLAWGAGMNEVLGPGAGAIGRALQSDLPWRAAAVLLGAKLVATALSLGLGAYGGVFMPSLVAGACLGTLVGSASTQVLGGDEATSVAYALVGMGAMFSALMHAPLTPIVMIFELTRDYAVILPLMLACILAAFVARRAGSEPFYRAVLHARGVVLPDEREDRGIRRARVASLVVPAPRVLTPMAPLSEVEAALQANKVGPVFVVAPDGAVVGVIDGRTLAQAVIGGAVSEHTTAADLADGAFSVLTPTDTVAGAIWAFARSDFDALPVADEAGRFVGIVRRADVLSRYADDLLAREEGALEVLTPEGVHEEVELAEGVILDHLVVPPRLDGATLAELDLRGRCGLLVVEWRRAERLLPVDPKAPLRAGDLLAVVGRREGILAARRIERRPPPHAAGSGGVR